MKQLYKTSEDIKTFNDEHIKRLAKDIHQDGVAVLYNQNLKETDHINVIKKFLMV